MYLPFSALIIDYTNVKTLKIDIIILLTCFSITTGTGFSMGISTCLTTSTGYG